MTQPNLDSPGARIKALRCRRILTIEALASKVGLSKSHFYKIERGAFSPSFDQTIRIAEALEVTLDYLAGKIDQNRELEDAVSRQALRIFLQQNEVEADLAATLWLIADDQAGPSTSRGWESLIKFVRPDRQGPAAIKLVRR